MYIIIIHLKFSSRPWITNIYTLLANSIFTYYRASGGVEPGNYHLHFSPEEKRRERKFYKDRQLPYPDPKGTLHALVGIF